MVCADLRQRPAMTPPPLHGIEEIGPDGVARATHVPCDKWSTTVTREHSIPCHLEQGPGSPPCAAFIRDNSPGSSHAVQLARAARILVWVCTRP
jgi:hypothetical protein